MHDHKHRHGLPEIIALLCGTAALLVTLGVVISGPPKTFFATVEPQSQTAGGWWCDTVGWDPFDDCDGGFPPLPIHHFGAPEAPYGGTTQLSWITGFHFWPAQEYAICTIYQNPRGRGDKSGGTSSQRWVIGPHPQPDQNGVYWYHGSMTIGPLYENTLYYIACTEYYLTGQSQNAAWTMVTVGAPQSPTLSLNAAPASVSPGDSSTLTWGVTNGSSRINACVLSGGRFGASTPVAASGSANTGSLTSTTQYGFNCYDTYFGWLGWKYTTVTVGSVPAGCTSSGCSLNCSPASVLAGESVQCTWSCNPAIYNSSSGSGFSTGGSMSGSQTLTVTQSTNFVLSCVAPSGTSVAGDSVTVREPVLSISANPARVRQNANTTLTWSATDVEAGSCRVRGGGQTWAQDSGSASVSIPVVTTFTLTCEVPTGEVSKSVTVQFIPEFEEI